MSNVDCTGTRFNDGTPIDSNNNGKNIAEDAFDGNEKSRWQGWPADDDQVTWVGMEWNTAKAVKCVSVLGKDNHIIKTFRIQAWESSTNSWQNVMIVTDHVPGVRQDIPLVYNPTVPVTSPPTKSPVKEAPTPTTPAPIPKPPTEPTTKTPTVTPTDGYKSWRLWSQADFAQK